VFALLGRLAATLTGREASGVAAVLRGWRYRDCSEGRRIRVGSGVELEGRGKIRFGEDVTLYGATYMNATGPSGSINIAAGTRIDRNCVFYGQGGLRIGANCAIAAGVIIYSQTNQYRAMPDTPINQQPVSFQAVSIGDDVWIGAGAIILPGVCVGSKAVIGAGAVVNHDVGPAEVVAGVPARCIGSRTAAPA
jgi:acetyltransferase-like isoleucine patch superfamily enzyme